MIPTTKLCRPCRREQPPEPYVVRAAGHDVEGFAAPEDGAAALRAYGRDGVTAELVRLSDGAVLAVASPHLEAVGPLRAAAERHNAKVVPPDPARSEKRLRTEKAKRRRCVCGVEDWERNEALNIRRCRACGVWAWVNGGGCFERIQIIRCCVCGEPATERRRRGQSAQFDNWCAAHAAGGQT